MEEIKLLQIEKRRIKRRVPADKRKRILQACAECKRRKQKCDGMVPCGRCTLRSATCVFEVDKRIKSSDLVSSPEDSTLMSIGDSAIKDDSASEGDAKVDQIPRLLNNPHGIPVYLGESGALSFLAKIRTITRKKLGPSIFTEDPERFRYADGYKLCGPALKATLPEPHIIQLSIRSFLDNINHLYYVASEEELQNLLHIYQSSETRLSRLQESFLHAILSVSSYYISVSEFRTLGELHFETARYLMGDVLEYVSFEHIRILLLLTLYLHYSEKRTAAYIYIGLAVRCAQSLGYHRVYMKSSIPVEQRLWWSLYIFDRYSSTGLGRPFAIEDRDMISPILKPLAPVPLTLKNEEIFIARVKLSRIVGIVVEEIYGRPFVSSSTAETISKTIRD